VGKAAEAGRLGKRVIVGMSGGVDSSVAAGLLLEQGFEVIGVTLNVWPELAASEALTRDDACCALGSVEDARRVADQLGIRHYVLNFREVFEERVIRNFVDEYRRGRTPNPCIRCNQYIKFEALWQRVAGLGADFIATGHYARVGYDAARKRYTLRKGSDPRKDQSYVLYPLSQATLAHTLFPLGDLSKEEARALATSWRLPVAAKAESQEICFVPNNDYVSFLRSRCADLPGSGPIYDREGRYLGNHQGIARYTVGQRRGLGLAGACRRFVIEIDPAANALVVGEECHLYVGGLVAEDVNWVSIEQPSGPIEVTAKVRYRATETPAVVFPLPDGRAEVRFSEPQRAITPGQAVVFYKGDLVVAGGTIARPIPLAAGS